MNDLLPILLRYAVSWVGAMMVAKGWATEEQWGALSAQLTVLGGVLVTVAPVVWAMLKKVRDKRDTDVVAAVKGHTVVLAEVAAKVDAAPAAAAAAVAAAVPGLPGVAPGYSAELVGRLLDAPGGKPVGAGA